VNAHKLLTSYSRRTLNSWLASFLAILANNLSPLNRALGGTTFRFLFLTNFRFFNISLVVFQFRGFSPKRFVNVANHCRESSNNICVVR